MGSGHSQLSFDIVDFSGITELDLHSNDKFLNTYSLEDLKKGFEKAVVEKLEKKGWPKEGFKYDIDVTDPFVHVCTVSHERLSHVSKSPASSFLIKIFVRRQNHDWAVDARYLFSQAAPKIFTDWIQQLPADERDIRAPFSRLPHMLKASIIEYMYLQDPLSDFRPERPRLPAQQFPGLGVGSEVFQLVIDAAKTHGRDLLLNLPENFHNAVIYNRHGMRFYSPHMQALFEVLQEDLAKELEKDFAKVAWDVHSGKLRTHDGQVIHWWKSEQIFALSEEVELFVQNSSRIVEKLKKHTHPRPYFRLDE